MFVIRDGYLLMFKEKVTLILERRKIQLLDSKLVMRSNHMVDSTRINRTVI